MHKLCSQTVKKTFSYLCKKTHVRERQKRGGGINKYIWCHSWTVHKQLTNRDSYSQKQLCGDTSPKMIVYQQWTVERHIALLNKVAPLESVRLEEWRHCNSIYRRMDVGACFCFLVVLSWRPIYGSPLASHPLLCTAPWQQRNKRNAHRKKRRRYGAHTTLSSNQHVHAGLRSGCLKYCEARAGRSHGTPDIAIVIGSRVLRNQIFGKTLGKIIVNFLLCSEVHRGKTDSSGRIPGRNNLAYWHRRRG